jgi:hypothetical protein
MFAMSVKSVPGCLVLIVPRFIGVPVAATPGFGPHEDVVEAVVVVLEAVEVVEVVELDAPLAAALELLLELPPHPTTSAAEPSSAASKIVTRLQVIMPRPLLIFARRRPDRSGYVV